jgi:hypothetical protein
MKEFSFFAKLIRPDCEEKAKQPHIVCHANATNNESNSQTTVTSI